MECKMEEHQKMVTGEAYSPSDPQLAVLSLRAKELLMQLNNTIDHGKRSELISTLIGTVGSNITLVSPFFCDYGHNIEIGDRCFINTNCVFLDCAPIKIGSNVFIAPSVQLYAATHPIDYIERRGAELAKPITIGDDCWIGGASVICPGVTIGDRSVVAAGSVVTRDVPEDTLVAGNPARIKRRLR